MSSLSPHPEERHLRRVSKDGTLSWPHGSRRRKRLLTMRNDHLRMILSENRSPLFGIMRYAPIAILGSASAFAFSSFSARRYSTGITLRNLGSQTLQFDRISAARREPVSLV